MTEALHWPVRPCSFVASDSRHAEFDTMEGRQLAVSKAAHDPRVAYPRSTRSKCSIRANVKKIGEGSDLPQPPEQLSVSSVARTSTGGGLANGHRSQRNRFPYRQ